MSDPELQLAILFAISARGFYSFLLRQKRQRPRERFCVRFGYCSVAKFQTKSHAGASESVSKLCELSLLSYFSADRFARITTTGCDKGKRREREYGGDEVIPRWLVRRLRTCAGNIAPRLRGLHRC